MKNCISGGFKLFFPFLAIFEIAKNGFWSKIFFREIDLFDFTSFFAWTFLNFLAHWASVKICLDDDDVKNGKI